jgi:hypothetical protein
MTVGGLYIANPRDALHYEELARPSSPTLFHRANLPRFGLMDSAGDTHVPLTTQVMTSVPVKLVAGETVTSLTFRSGATAAGTPTNWWFALYDNSATPALLAQTADQTTTAWAANTTMTKALATAQVIDETGIYWAAIMVKATTVPSLLGCVCMAAIAALSDRNLAQTSGSSLTTTAPATIATPAHQNFAPYVVLT